MKLFGFISMLTGSQLIIQKLIDHNVDTLFGYTGGSNLHFFNELKKQDKIKVIFNRHEQFVGHSAEGYSKSSNKIGIVCTTSGPGLTNMITPLQDSYSDGIPMIYISGQVSKKNLGTHAFQEVDSINLTKYCTKWNYLVDSINKLEFAIDTAFIKCQLGKKGPVHIDICSDVFKSEICDDKEQLDKTLHQIINNINQSKKPIMIVGRGSLKCFKEIRQLSQKFKIPVTSTLHGVGIMDENEELALKMLGMHGTAYANKAVQKADLIIGLGNRFDDRTIGDPPFFGVNAKQKNGIIHVNIDNQDIDVANNVIQPNISINMDTLEFCNRIKNNLIITERDEWMNDIKELKQKYPLSFTKDQYHLKTQEVLMELNHHIKNLDYYITTGVGNHQMMTAQFIHWNRPNRLITSGSLGTMGTGLPFAIGTKLANPDSMIFCIDGDGSFMMSLQELATIFENNLDIKILIMNDNRLQMVHTWQELFYDKNIIGTQLMNPDFVKLGKSFRIQTLYCSSKTDLKETIHKILNSKGPLLCEFKVVPDICLPFVAPGKKLEDPMLLLDEKD